MMRPWLLVILAGLLAPSAPAQGVWRPPVAERVVLPSGLVVLCHRQPSSEMATVTAMVRAGSAADPDSLPGLANFAAEMLARGSKSHSAEQIAYRIDFLGAGLSADCDRDASYLTLTCLARHLDSLLPVFLDVLARPVFDSAETEIMRRELLASLKMRQDRHRQVSEEAFDSLLYGAHPYGHPAMGRPGPLGRLTPSHLRLFHREFYVPNNAAVAIVSPFAGSKMVSKIRLLTSGWKPGAQHKVPLPEVELPPSPRALYLHRPVSQAYITLGFLGPRRRDPDYQAARLMNYILGGGGFSSRLTKSIRVRHGLAYDVDSYFDPRLGPGPFRFTVQTKTASADTAVKLILGHISEMIESPVGDSELSEAREYLLGSYPFRFETGQQMARQFLLLELEGLSPGYFAEDLRLTSEAGAADLQAAARRLLAPGRFLMAVAGDTAKIRIGLPGPEPERR